MTGAAALIYNPNAGGIAKHPHRIEGAVERMRGAGWRVQVHATRGPGHATDLAAEAVGSGVQLVAVAGGDGTLNEAANGMIGSGTALAVLPGGTANVLACETGIPHNVEMAAGRLRDMQPVRMAVGKITAAGGSRHFLLMAGAGLDAEVVARVDSSLKHRSGKLAYWVAGLSLIGRRLPQLRVRTGARNATTGFALVSRVRNYGGDLTIAAGASLLSDEFEVLTFAGSTTWPYAFYLGGALIGKAAWLPGVTVLRTGRLELEPASDVEIRTQLDGEPGPSLPATLEIVPNAITLLAPERFNTAPSSRVAR